MNNSFFNSSAFNELDASIKRDFEEFFINIQNKPPNEISMLAINFYNKLQNNKSFTKKERELLIELILGSLPDSDKKRFFEVFTTVTNMKQ